jgi:hypothetical protein
MINDNNVDIIEKDNELYLEEQNEIKEKAKIAIENAINKHIILKSILIGAKQYDRIIKFIPEIILIMLESDKGIAILKEFGIYDYFTKDKNQ